MCLVTAYNNIITYKKALLANFEFRGRSGVIKIAMQIQKNNEYSNFLYRHGNQQSKWKPVQKPVGFCLIQISIIFYNNF